MTLERELEVATAAARDAMAAINAVSAKARANPTQKAGGEGPVTEADLAADRVLRDHLVAAFPDDALVTEETWTGDEPPHAPRVWFCDPLDGTQEYVHGNDDFVVMIGLVIEGEPALGVVAQPTTGTIWRGVVADGRCERLDGEAVASRDVRSRTVPQTPRAMVSRSHGSKLTDRVAAAVGGVAIKKGSVGLKVTAIVDDEAEVYLSGSSRMKLWDSAGPVAILRAAGGDVTSLDGEPLLYRVTMNHPKGMFAAPPEVRVGLKPSINAALSDWRASRKNKKPAAT